MYAANVYICTPTQTHTHTGAQFIYVAVYYHYHQTRGSKQEPGCISLLDAHHHCLSLRCLSSCHFGGSPAGIPTLLCPLCRLQTFIVFITFCVCFSGPYCPYLLLFFSLFISFSFIFMQPPLHTQVFLFTFFLLPLYSFAVMTIASLLHYYLSKF